MASELPENDDGDSEEEVVAAESNDFNQLLEAVSPEVQIELPKDALNDSSNSD